MNELQIFENSEFGAIRTMTIDREPWFVGKDVTEILGYLNASKALSDHVDAEDKLNNESLSSLGQRGGWLINESGLYSLILSSKLESAKRFKRWVTSEVLPAIRKHGAYATDELLNNPDLAIKAFQALKEERARNKELEAQMQADKPKIVFADAVESSKTSILIGDLAKLIKQNGVDIGQQRLFSWMRDKGYLIKSGNSRNMPTQKSMELELFDVKIRAITNADGSIFETKTTKVTGKGQQYFVNLFLNK